MYHNLTSEKMKYLTINELWNIVYTQLKTTAIESARVETDVILSKGLNVDKSFIYTYPEQLVRNKDFRRVLRYTFLRTCKIPLAYILAEKEFFGLLFKVNNKVLIPRQETEFVVETAISIIKTISETTYEKIVCADIGTGCGNIAISVVKNLLNINLEMYATDISSSAIKLAKQNAKLHNVGDKIKFVTTNLLKYFIDNRILLDVILSNPPYVSEQEYEQLQPEIYFEPKKALVAKTGLEYYKYFAKHAGYVLRPNGKLVLEVNPNLIHKICELFFQSGYNIKKIVSDYSSLPRVIVVEKNT